MAPFREIEKLQRRWQENPLGLTFAPLAEAYRKEGKFPEAIELLTIGLVQHPNYVPAHIVRGRCFLDTRADKAAEAAFLQVIDLDSENVIALKCLADIAERTGRFEDARGHLEQLLEFDRSNEEAREQLVRVVAGMRMPRPGQMDLPGPPAAVVDEPRVAAAEEPGRAKLEDLEPAALGELEPATVDELEPAAIDEPAPAAIEAALPQPSPTDYSAIFGAVSDDFDLEADETSTDDTPLPDDAEPTALPDRIDDANESPIAAVVDIADDHLEVVAFMPLELSGAGSGEYQQPDAAAGLRPEEARGTGHLLEDLGVIDDIEEQAEVVPAEPVESPPPAEVVAELEDVADPEPDAELVITESMAELFLNQGHRELALAVYTQLLTRDPDNARLQAAIEELRPAAPEPRAPGLPAYAAVLTGGQSVRGFFEHLLSVSRPQAQPEDDGVSLGSVFGDGVAAGPNAKAAPDDAGPTFDEFFASDLSAPPPVASAESGEDEDGAPEDIESFTTWLKGLKR